MTLHVPINRDMILLRSKDTKTLRINTKTTIEHRKSIGVKKLRVIRRVIVKS